MWSASLDPIEKANFILSSQLGPRSAHGKLRCRLLDGPRTFRVCCTRMGNGTRRGSTALLSILCPWNRPRSRIASNHGNPSIPPPLRIQLIKAAAVLAALGSFRCPSHSSRITLRNLSAPCARRMESKELNARVLEVARYRSFNSRHALPIKHPEGN